MEKMLRECHRCEIDPTRFEDIFSLPELKAIRMILSRAVLSKLIE